MKNNFVYSWYFTLTTIDTNETVLDSGLSRGGASLWRGPRLGQNTVVSGCTTSKVLQFELGTLGFFTMLFKVLKSPGAW